MLQILYKLCDWICILDLVNGKYFFCPIWSIPSVKHFSLEFAYSHFVYRYSKIFAPTKQIKIAHWNIFVKFGFYKIAFISGIELKGLFFPNICPLTDLFFYPVQWYDPMFQKKGCGVPNLGAPFPNTLLTKSAANGIPIEANKLPKIPPHWTLVGFIVTFPPVFKALRIPCFCFVVNRCL